MKNKVVLYDLLFYLAIPFIVWKLGRDPLGDYYAILLSTAPGFCYSLFRFIVLKQFNFTGLFIISTLLISTLIDLLSGSAENMLWNQVYYGIAMGTFLLITILLKRPLALYFAVDMSALQGYQRESSFEFYKTKKLFTYLQLLTGLYMFKSYFNSGVKGYLVYKYGVEQYDLILLVLRISSWIFTGLILIGLLLVNKHIFEISKQYNVKTEQQQ